MDTNIWICLLISRILKKPCKGQIRSRGKEEKNETFTEQLLVFPSTQYLTRSTKKWKLFAYLIRISKVGKLVNSFSHWIAARVIGTWLSWQPKQDLKVFDDRISKYTVQEKTNFIFCFKIHMYICIHLGGNGQIIIYRDHLLISHVHNTISTMT